MNKSQQKAVNKAEGMVAEAVSELGAVRDALQELFDEKSEKWQESDPGQELQAEIEVIEQAISNLEDVQNELPTQAV